MSDRVALAMLAGILTTITLVGCSNKVEIESPASRPAKLFTVYSSARIEERRYPAVVEANEEADLSFKVNGTVVELRVKQGQEVKKGDVVARLDARDYELALNRAQSQLQETQAQERAMKAGVRPEDVRILENNFQAAKTEFERDERFFKQRQGLVESGAISREELQTTEAAYLVSKAKLETAGKELEKGKSGARKEDIEAIEARVRNLQENVKNAENALADTILLAPYTARVIDKHIDAFEEISAKQSIVRLQKIDVVKLAFGLPEKIVLHLKRGDPGIFTAEFDGLPGKTFPVNMHEYRLEADPKTRTFICKVAMPTVSEAIILPGMSAEIIHKESNDQASGIRIPASAVFADETKVEFVWKVDSDMRVHKNPVEAGLLSGDDIWIAKGLGEGDVIVTAGVNYLTEGMKVHHLESRS